MLMSWLRSWPPRALVPFTTDVWCKAAIARSLMQVVSPHTNELLASACCCASTRLECGQRVKSLARLAQASLQRRPISLSAGHRPVSRHVPGLPPTVVVVKRMIWITGPLLLFATLGLAADQGPDFAYPLTVQFRPDTKWRSCKAAGNAKTNCGFCYGPSGSFQGWNCACDTFVSLSSIFAGPQLLTYKKCSGTKNSCFYILESDPNNYAAVSCTG